MFCTKCGCLNDDNSAFCKKCGAALTSSNNTQQTPNIQSAASMQQPPVQPGQNPPGNTVRPQPGVYTSTYQPGRQSASNGSQWQPQNPYQPQQAAPVYMQTNMQVPFMGNQFSDAQRRVLDTVKSVCASPLFLIATILYSVSLLFSLVSIISASSVFGYYVEEYSIAFSSGGILGFLIGSLVAIGLWITYASAKNKFNIGMTTSGLTMTKVVVVIELVFICIAIGILLIAMIVIATFAGSLYSSNMFDLSVSNISSVYYGDSYGANHSVPVYSGFVIIIIYIAVLVISIIYYAKLIQTINAVKNAISNGRATNKASMFVVVFNFILGGVAFIFSFVSLVSFNIFGWLGSLCSAAVQIIFGILIIQFRSKMLPLVYQNSGVINGTYSQGGQPQPSIYQPQPQRTASQPQMPPQPIYQPQPQRPNAYQPQTPPQPVYQPQTPSQPVYQPASQQSVQAPISQQEMQSEAQYDPVENTTDASAHQTDNIDQTSDSDEAPVQTVENEDILEIADSE